MQLLSCIYAQYSMYVRTYIIGYCEAGITTDSELSPKNLALLIVGTSLLGVGIALFCAVHLIMKWCTDRRSKFVCWSSYS